MIPPEGFDDERGYGLLAVTAQRAVMPRRLEEGIYAVLDADGAVQVVETSGYKAQRKHDWMQARSDRPEFVHRAVELLDVCSFVDYLARNTADLVGEGEGVQEPFAYGTGVLELWADLETGRVLAILDGCHGLRKHTATLRLRTSREWGEWMGIDGKLLSQVEFAQFVEDHLSTIAEPDGGVLLDVCQTLEATKGALFKQQSILASGQRTFRWEETVEAKAGQKGDLAIPGTLTLALRPFQGSDRLPVVARFRFRPEADGLRLGVKLAETDAILEQAFADVVAGVQAQVPVRVNYGRP